MTPELKVEQIEHGRGQVLPNSDKDRISPKARSSGLTMTLIGSIPIAMMLLLFMYNISIGKLF